MSRVLMNRVFAKDTFKVSASTISTGWKAGQFFTLNSLQEAILAVTDQAMFMGVDSATLSNTELSNPPSASVLTGIYGIGSKIYIDHTEEVLAGSSTRAYASAVESASVGALLYVDASGKFTSTSTGSVKGVLIQVPASSNNYSLGAILRI